MKNYIVLDLEWNQSDGKASRKENLPFEVIEIGAVKMTEEYLLVDEFDELIRPSVYPKLFGITQKLTGIRQKDLVKARPFKEVAEDFFRWCGEDYVLCTWGNMDLTELQRNMDYFGVDYHLPSPLFYFDIQKMYSLYEEFEESSNSKLPRFSLEEAVKQQGIQTDIPFHRASADTLYTALVMSSIDMERVKDFFSVDYHCIPEDDLELSFPGYDKFVTHEYEDRDEMLKDPTLTRIRCNLCGKSVRQKIRWFSVGRNYLCVGTCPEHGLIKGKIRVRKSDANGWYAIRTTKQISDAECEEIRAKKQKKEEGASSAQQQQQSPNTEG